MRQTFTMLQNTSKDYISQNAGSFATSTIGNFIKEHINKHYSFIQRKIDTYIQKDLPQTASTVADQQRYHYPPNVTPPIDAATLTQSSVVYDLDVVTSQKIWNDLNEIDFSGTTIPQYILIMRDHFELWPTPQSSGDTITLYARLMSKPMTAEDYSTGTVTTADNSTAIVGNGTTWTTAMQKRWFVLTDSNGLPSGDWYRINTVTDTTNLTLETAYDGSGDNGLTYLIGETPEIPVDVHELIPHGVAADFYAGPRKDFASAQAHLNYYWTGDYDKSTRNPKLVSGGLLDVIRRYSKGSDRKVITRGRKRWNRFDERWSATLTSTI